MQVADFWAGDLGRGSGGANDSPQWLVNRV